MATAPDPGTLIEVGETAVQLAKELVETNREIEIKVENKTKGARLSPAGRYGGSNTQCLSALVEIGPGEWEGMVYSKPKGSLAGCWGYQSFTFDGYSHSQLVVFFSVPAVGDNAFWINGHSGDLVFNNKEAMDFYHHSRWASTGTISIDFAGSYIIRANMSDSYTAQMVVWIEDK